MSTENTSINNGGPAFPRDSKWNLDGSLCQRGAVGMSLRDWFAGQALNGYLSNRISMAAAVCESKEKNVEFPTYLARLSYEMADAMLAASKNTPS